MKHFQSPIGNHCSTLTYLWFLHRYDFVPPVQYNYLNDEEAEERFEKRNKTLNYFSIMVSKRIREKEGKEVEEAEEKSKLGKKKGNLVSDSIQLMYYSTILSYVQQLVESDSDEFSSVDSDRDDDGDQTPLILSLLLSLK